jgi:hypothetical protein
MVTASTLVLVELVGLAEIAEMLKLSKARADQLARRIWDKSAVEAWMRSTGRLK